MTTSPTQGEHAQTALRLADEYAAAHAKWALEDLYGSSRSYTSEKLTERHAARAKLERALHAQVAALTPAQPAAPQGVAYAALADVDALAQEIRRVDGSHNLGAGALAEALMPFLRASHGKAPAGAAPEPIAYLHDDGYWTPTKTAEGRKLNDRLHFAGSPKIGVHLAPTAQAAPAAGITVEQVEDAIGLQSTAWNTIGAEKIVEAVLRLANGQAPAAGAVAGPDDDIDAVALARYKVVPSHDSMFHRFAVVAGDGKQQLYLGRETECQNMARKFAGAFLDGAFHQSQIAAAPTPAAQADSVLEDADRWRMAVLVGKEVMLHPEKRTHANAVKAYMDAVHSGLDLTGAVDAARKQGGTHDNH